MRVVYSKAVVAPAQGFSPSAAKPEAVMAAWRLRWPGIEERPAIPATVAELCRAHSSRYIEDVLALRRANGFGTVSPDVAASLPHTSGALLTAARWALRESTVVAAPVSGFHHARWDSGGGYCTFNGLMVAALALQADSPGRRVGILDYDYHYGDGTDDILDRLQPAGIVHVTAGTRWNRPEQADDFLAGISDDLEQMGGCDIVLYQAGADAHVEDPLGGLLTTAQLAERDRRVFTGLRARAIPVAWDLAGGYQSPLEKVVAIHVNTFAAASALDDPLGPLDPNPRGGASSFKSTLA
jgi:acetoin utilization deacetylase AcuC-like enzyme